MEKLDTLKEKLAAYEAEFETAKATVYRLDGVIQYLKNEISEAEKPESTSVEPPELGETPVSE